MRPRSLSMLFRSPAFTMAFRRTFRSTITLKSAKTWCTTTFSIPWSFVVPKWYSSNSGETVRIKLSRGSSPSVLPYEVLPYDILVIIFEFVSDSKTLFNACLVSKAFDDAANRILWQRLTDDPLRSKVRIFISTYSIENTLICRIRQLVTMKQTRGRLARTLLWDSEETYRESIVVSSSYLLIS